ncbi:MAG: hypothetical protein QNI99_07545 [Woeseiaceae bacterium]|nr:hypothetical protein [Woeseiaceae bacterium]
MKNLLVDALRQAKSERPDDESDDSVRLGETPVEGASNDGDEYVEEYNDDTFELMQTTTDLVVVDVEVEVEDEAEGAGPDADAAFEEAFELSASGRSGSASPKPEPVRHGRPEGFIEHSARWLPAVCAVLLLAAMSALPVWNSLMSDDGNLGLTVGGTTMPPVADGSESDVESTRFPFASAPAPAPVRTTNVAPPVAVDPPPQRVDVVVQVRERRPAGATDLADDTFSTIAALYRAHLSGEVSRTGLAEILDARVRQREPGTESELKVLLQQYPDESILHNALGTLLADEARWPEARAAFARAAETAEGAR